MTDNSLPASWVQLSVRTSARGPFLDPDGRLYCTTNSAAAFEALNREFIAHFGYALPVIEAGRTRNRQNYLYQGYINHLPGFNLAAPPGHSVHEFGNAWDFGGKCATHGTAEHNWLVATGPRFGIIWTGKNFSVVEAWHFEQNGLIVAGHGTPIIEKKADPDMPDYYHANGGSDDGLIVNGWVYKQVGDGPLLGISNLEYEHVVVTQQRPVCDTLSGNDIRIIAMLYGFAEYLPIPKGFTDIHDGTKLTGRGPLTGRIIRDVTTDPQYPTVTVAK